MGSRGGSDCEYEGRLAGYADVPSFVQRNPAARRTLTMNQAH